MEPDMWTHGEIASEYDDGDGSGDNDGDGKTNEWSPAGCFLSDCVKTPTKSIATENNEFITC